MAATGAVRRSGSVQVMSFKPAVFVFGQRPCSFTTQSPQFIIADAMLVADGGVVDMAADHPIRAMSRASAASVRSKAPI